MKWTKEKVKVEFQNLRIVVGLNRRLKIQIVRIIIILIIINILFRDSALRAKYIIGFPLSLYVVADPLTYLVCKKVLIILGDINT